MKAEARLELLCESLSNGDRDLAKEMVNVVATINGCDKHGNLPMVCAADKGDIDMLQYLIINGGEIDIPNGQGITPLLAAKAGGFEAASALLENYGAALDLSANAVVDAILKDQLLRLECLLKAGAVVDEFDAEGQIPLMYAVMRAKVPAICRLLEAGADPLKPDKAGITALSLARFLKKEEMISLLS